MKTPKNELPPPTPGHPEMAAEGVADYSANRLLALRVPAHCAGLRLDQALAALYPQHSRSRLQGWIRAGRVTVGGQPVLEAKAKVWGGEAVTVDEVPDAACQASRPEAIALNVAFEDECLIVIDKPAGLVVHPGNGNWSGTLLNALLFHAPELARVPRAGIVHRLDKETSGLMVVARTPAAQTDLVRQLQARTVKRHYYALARGALEGGGTVDAPVGRHPRLRTRMAVTPGGKPARTHYRIVQRFVDCTLVECALETGRTHQIRVHLESIGHPLVGDPVYGARASRVPSGPPFGRQALHARRLGLIHPLSGKAMSWTSELPGDMAALIALVREQADAAALRMAEDDDDAAFADGPEIIYARGDVYGVSGRDEDADDDDLE